MGFTLCSNAHCIRACWCKRFTYKQRLQEAVTLYKTMHFNCNEEDGYPAYRKNKAREHYEKEHPDDILTNE